MVVIEVAAPGKVILHGEHAVVFGKHAIAMSIGLKTNVRLTTRNDEKVELYLTKFGQHAKWDFEFLSTLPSNKEDTVDELSSTAVYDIKNMTHLDSLDTDSAKTSALMFLFLYSSILNKYYNGNLPALTVHVDTELCIGAGLGSSASYAVCLATALLLLCGKINKDITEEDRKLISLWAFQAERIPHFSPSGIDNTVCTYGGAILYKDKKIVKRLRSVSKLKSIVVNTSEPKCTKEMVLGVRQRYDLYPTVFQSIIEAIDNAALQTWEMMEILESPAFDSLCADKLMYLVQMNHYLLNALGVGHPKIDEIVRLSAEHKCGAKVTGAGGGGCALIVQPPITGCEHVTLELLKSNVAHLKEAITTKGLKFWDSMMGSTGVEVKIFLLHGTDGDS